jgi:hypothetical protein
MHNMNNLFTKAEADDNDHTLVLPRLSYFSLETLLVSAPSLIKFISVQPRLKALSFGNVYFSTPGSKWSQVASALPVSVETWKVSKVGHDPIPSGPVQASYLYTPTWSPDDEPLPVETGWKVVEKAYTPGDASVKLENRVFKRL